MASAFDIELAALPADERAEVERLLVDRPGALWSSDEDDGMLPDAIVAVAAIGGIVATLINYPLAEIAAFYRDLPRMLPYGLTSPIMGFTLAVLAVPLLVRRFRRLHGRHGWLVTSFGLVRVRGPRLRVARWEDVERISRRYIGIRPRGFAMVELATRHGTLECDTGAVYSEAVKRVPARATVVDGLG